MKSSGGTFASYPNVIGHHEILWKNSGRAKKDFYSNLNFSALQRSVFSLLSSFFFSCLGSHADFWMYWPWGCSSEPECKWTLLGLRCPLLERFPGQGSGPAQTHKIATNSLISERLPDGTIPSNEIRKVELDLSRSQKEKAAAESHFYTCVAEYNKACHANQQLINFMSTFF